MEPDTTPTLVSLLGPSGSGKTTLAARLVRRWAAHGLRVGFAKHASHGFHMDREGKDTERVAREGGAGVAVTGPQGTAYLDAAQESSPSILAARFFEGRHVLVLEGFREAALPAVVLAGEENTTEFLDLVRGPILALVAESTGAAAVAAESRDIPRFDTGDLEGLAIHLEEALGLRAPS